MDVQFICVMHRLNSSAEIITSHKLPWLLAFSKQPYLQQWLRLHNSLRPKAYQHTMTTHSLHAQSLYRTEPAKHRFVLQHTPTRRACPTSPPSLVRKRLAPQLGAARILATTPPACDYHCVMKSSWQPASIQLQTTAGMHSCYCAFAGKSLWTQQ